MLITSLLQREHGECLIKSRCPHWLVGCMEHVNTCTTRHTDTPMLPQPQPHYPFLAQHSQPGTLRHKLSQNCGQADVDLINRIALFPPSAMWYVVLGRHIEVPSTANKTPWNWKELSNVAPAGRGKGNPACLLSGVIIRMKAMNRMGSAAQLWVSGTCMEREVMFPSHLTNLLKKLVRLGCISEGFSSWNLPTKGFWFTRRFSSSLLPSKGVMAYRVCMCYMCKGDS